MGQHSERILLGYESCHRVLEDQQDDMKAENDTDDTKEDGQHLHH